MPQYPIPQFIEEESKIVFFLTFRQFFTLIGGGIVVIVWYWTVAASHFNLFVFGALAIMAVAAAIAFLRINNVSVIRAALQWFGFVTAKKTYVWKKK